MLRTLRHYWRGSLAVSLGVATTTAVLSGAMLVGDSVSRSLRDLTLDRLGRIDRALVAGRYLQEGVATALQERSRSKTISIVPIILVTGGATNATTHARASDVTILGVDAAFADLYPDGGDGVLPDAPSGGVVPSVVINGSLAGQTGAAVGDHILISFPRPADAPPDTVLGRRELENVAGLLRCEVRGVIPDSGPGRFGLEPRQAQTGIAYLHLRDLQKALAQPGRVNALLATSTLPEPADLDASLRDLVELDDLGLILSRGAGHVSLESRELILRPEIVESAEGAALALSGRVQRVQTYLAIEIRSRTGSIPYSTMTAIDPVSPPFAPLTLVDGSPAPRLGDAEILLNTWAAADLRASPGDELELSYFVVGEREQLRVESARLRLQGIVAMTGLGGDASLTPDYPGIRKSRDIAAWDPPFPIELARIRKVDEEYWDQYGPTPKAFVSEATGRRLWAGRYGATTAIRVAPPASADPAEFTAQLKAALRERLPMDLFGLRFRAVRQEGLSASAGSTDFGALFMGFSMFLIVSSAMLGALLFRLFVQRRASEIGLLQALGYPAKAVRRRFITEGLALAGGGALAGLAAGIAYSGLLMLGLRTLWRPAVGSSHLYLHVSIVTLTIAGSVSLAIALSCAAWTVRALCRQPAVELISGRADRPAPGARVRLAAWTCIAGLGTATILAATAVATGSASSPGLSFGMGAALLAGALAAFSWWCGSAGRTRSMAPGSGMAAMAARNATWSPGRSLLCVALIGCACFVIVTVAASRRGAHASHLETLDSGSGGYALVAESEIPLHQDLGTPGGRLVLGIRGSAEPLLATMRVTSFRLLPGEDASCLNLYRPGRPRLLGVPEDQIRRGGFSFQGLVQTTSSPWELLRLDLGPGVVPAFGDANSVKWILHSGLGQDLPIRDEMGREVSLRFVGLLEGSVLQSELLVSEEHLKRLFPSLSGYSFFMIEAPFDQAGPITQELETSLGGLGFDAVSTADRLASFHTVENTYLSTFQTLGGLGLLLGTIGMAVVAARNISERRGELAALRAMGFARSRLAWMVMVENAFLLALGIIAGGLAALAAVAARLYSGEARPDWLPLMTTLAVVLAFGMLSTAWAVAGALRTPLLPALKTDH